MDHLDEWFPYDNYRPNQRQMLEVVAASAKQGGIVMIDAPTGSGKSSAVAALLSERGSRKVIIAVRTISQLTTFIRELSLIKKKKPSVKIFISCRKIQFMSPWWGRGCLPTMRRCKRSYYIADARTC